MIRIGLVDDQPLVRAGFAMLIGSQPDLEVAWQASDGDEVPGQDAVDVVLMDVQMARTDGITATRELVSRDPRVQVIMLTTFDDQDFVHGAIAAGAAGFLLKDVEPEELLAGIRTVHAGEAVLSPRVTAQVLQQLRQGSPVRECKVPLTTRELEILRLIARGYSNTEIAEAEVVSMATVKTHVRHILTKTGSRDRVHAVLYAFRNGVVDVHQLLHHP